MLLLLLNVTNPLSIVISLSLCALGSKAPDAIVSSHTLVVFPLITKFLSTSE